MSYPADHTKHNPSYPSARKIRRTCSKELYRARKKLNRWIPPHLVAEGEQLYYRIVLMHLPFVFENSSNRKRLCDFWDEHVCSDLAKLWEVEPGVLSKAFRDSFGG